MARFPVDAPKRTVIRALERLGFRVLREKEHVSTDLAKPCSQALRAAGHPRWGSGRKNRQTLRLGKLALPLVKSIESVRLEDRDCRHVEKVEGSDAEFRCMATASPIEIAHIICE